MHEALPVNFKINPRLHQTLITHTANEKTDKK